MVRRMSARLPPALVLISLVSLILLPIAVQQKHSASWKAIAEVVRPSRDLVDRMQLSLSREAAGTRGFLLTLDQSYADEHMQARAERKHVYAELLRDSGRLGPGFQDEVRHLGQLLEPADALLDSLYSGQVTPNQYMASLPAQHERFLEVTATTARLHETLDRAEAAWTGEIMRIQRVDTVLTVVLVLLALAAGMAVARLGRSHRLAAEREHAARALSEEARAEAERRRLEVERLGANWQMLIRGFSHDLKNPLNAAAGFLRMLEQGHMDPLTPHQAQGVVKVQRSVSTTLQLIGDLLAVARAEAGQIEVTRAAVDLREAARAVVDEYRGLAESKGLVLRAENPDAFPAVESDGVRVQQILANLVSNAINYTEAGEVTVRVEVRGHPDPDRSGQWAVVEVSDTGPGLSEEQQRIAFDEFRRLDTSGGTTGSGIGLAISSRLARALGGEIKVRSEVGRGASFALCLPLAVPSCETADAGVGV